MTDQNAIIRPARVSDMAACYRVALLTGDSGADASALHPDPDLLGHVYVGPYLAMDGAIGFAALDEQGVAGYTLAALDTAAFEDVCEQFWWPQLRQDYRDPGEHPTTPDEELRMLIHRPERSSSTVTASHPAHLHIDLHPRLQGQGVGTRLIQTLLDDLRDRSVAGVHLGVALTNLRAINFYRRLGFVDLDTTSDSLIMGLRLDDQQSAGSAR